MKNFPIGGVGESGMGRYFGKSTFETFSNQKMFFHKKYYAHRFEKYSFLLFMLKLTSIPLPPMTKKKMDMFKWFL